MFGIIGGTGLGQLAQLQNLQSEQVETQYGSSYLELGDVGSQRIAFLPRHGSPANRPPHQVNYRANIRALQAKGVTKIIAVTAVGSVDPSLEVGQVVIPDQIVDYTSGRQHTFFDDEIHHIDFTYPYTASLRETLINAADANPLVKYTATGVYGCTNGPRLETAAEIVKLGHDGCTIVGMTAMPEAALAREAGLEYAGFSVIVNKGAGLAGALDLDEISQTLDASMSNVGDLLRAIVGSSDQ